MWDCAQLVRAVTRGGVQCNVDHVRGRFIPRKRASPPGRAKLIMDICSGTLDATVNTLTASGIMLNLVVIAFAFAQGFLSAERRGGQQYKNSEHACDFTS